MLPPRFSLKTSKSKTTFILYHKANVLKNLSYISSKTTSSVSVRHMSARVPISERPIILRLLLLCSQLGVCRATSIDKERECTRPVRLFTALSTLPVLLVRHFRRPSRARKAERPCARVCAITITLTWSRIADKSIFLRQSNKDGTRQRIRKVLVQSIPRKVFFRLSSTYDYRLCSR